MRHCAIIALLGDIALLYAARPASGAPKSRPAASKSVAAHKSGSKVHIPSNVPSLGEFGMPHFEINLDAPPDSRWMHIAHYYRQPLIEHLDNVIPHIGDSFLESSHTWLQQVPFDQEYEAELNGMVRALNHPSVTTERMKWLNMLYEMDSPMYNPGCTGVLWAMENGTVIQGRNMDDFNVLADPLRPSNKLSELIHDVTAYRHGVPIFTVSTLPGRVGIGHGMRHGHNRLGGWAFAQNTRKPNEWKTNLEAAKRNGQVYGLAIRKIMEMTEDYDTAVSWLSSTQFMAPHYFIVSGARPGQGVVLSIDRLAQRSDLTPLSTYLLFDNLDKVEDNRLEHPNNWFLVQTNDDIDKKPVMDMRRPFANHLLSTTTRSIATPEHMLQFLHTTPMMNPGTVVTTVMVPATGYYKSIYPTDKPAIIDGNAFDQKLFEQEFLAKFPAPPPETMHQVKEKYQLDMSMPYGSYDPEKELGGLANAPVQGMSLTSLMQEHEPQTARRTSHKGKFLDSQTHQKHHATAVNAPADEVSFIQHSWKLEA